MSKLPDFEGLAMFAKVAEERSFAGAAQAMGVSVATVSRADTGAAGADASAMAPVRGLGISRRE
jgi:Bacterial regulatory helix-turn-helix protein, lysR family